jgi:hypothetical protein
MCALDRGRILLAGDVDFGFMFALINVVVFGGKPWSNFFLQATHFFPVSLERG